jgi:hypothetical protein
MRLRETKLSFEHINQVRVWESILMSDVSLRKMYRNPTRIDKHPGCRFMYRDNNWVLMDFSKNSGMNCVQCLMKQHGISYYEALKMAYRLAGTSGNFFSTKLETVEKRETKKGIITIVPKTDQKFLDYWKSLGVKKSQLQRESTLVFCVQKLEIKFEYKKIIYPNDLCIAYKGEDGYKIYFPEREKPRFKSSLSEEDVWSVTNNPDKLIVAKSHKDLLVIESLLSGTDWSFSMVQNEGSFPKKKGWENILNLVSFFDNDNAGKAASEKFKEHYINAQSIEIDPTFKCKDISDFVLKYGVTEAKTYLLSLLESPTFPPL